MFIWKNKEAAGPRRNNMRKITALGQIVAADRKLTPRWSVFGRRQQSRTFLLPFIVNLRLFYNFIISCQLNFEFIF
jgi:hypothetical protein